MLARSVGPRNRVNYTVHGDAVNLAARRETLNWDYGERVLASQASVDLPGEESPRQRIGELPIRGKRSAVTVYRPA